MSDPVSDAPNAAAEASDAPGTAAAATPVLHLPAFTSTDAAPWFQRVEALFRLRSVSSSTKKADFVIGALPAEIFSQISRWLATKGTDTIHYEELKTEIILQCEPTPEEKSQKILELLRMPLGDQRPSAALREIRSLQTVLRPDGTSADLDLGRVLWMLRLPQDIRTHITDFAGRSDKDLMKLADSVRGTSRLAQTVTTAAAHHVDVSDEDEYAMAAQQRHPPRSSTQRHVPDASRRTLCYFHKRFGRDARNCRPHCYYYSKNM